MIQEEKKAVRNIGEKKRGNMLKAFHGSKNSKNVNQIMNRIPNFAIEKCSGKETSILMSVIESSMKDGKQSVYKKRKNA